MAVSVKTIASSVFVQTVGLLIAAAVFVLLALPPIIRFTQPDYIDGDELMCKIPDFIADKNHYDVVFMGSSLILAPAIGLDSVMLGKNVNGNIVDHKRTAHYYPKCLYFEDLLRKQFHRDLTVYNLGIPGCMVSDNYNFFKEILASKKVPAFVILALAPRDFMHRGFDPHNTPIQKAYKRYQDKANAKPEEELDLSLIETSKKLVEKGKEQLALVKHFAGSGLDSWRKDPFGKNTPKFDQGRVATDEGGQPGEELLKRDLQMYDERYNPPDVNMVRTHIDYLNKLLALARASGVPVVVVNMPITERNKTVLDAELLATIRKGMTDACTKYGAKYLDYDSTKEYKLSDYKDSVHLNLRGSRKFYKELAEALHETPALDTRLAEHGQKRIVSGVSSLEERSQATREARPGPPASRRLLNQQKQISESSNGGQVQ